MRQVKVTKTLEDGSKEEYLLDIPADKKKPKKSKRKRVSNEDNKKQEKEQTTSTSKASIGITRTES